MLAKVEATNPQGILAHLSRAAGVPMDARGIKRLVAAMDKLGLSFAHDPDADRSALTRLLECDRCAALLDPQRYLSVHVANKVTAYCKRCFEVHVIPAF